MEWKDWDSVLFAQRDNLPEISGIYVVADQVDFVWYVGQATNLKTRWAGKGHHRYPQLIRSNKKRNHKIYWHSVPISDLDEQEQHYIGQFKPELNGCKVKSYLPKKPQHEREIKRLLRTLNNPTFLFPTFRSVVAGEYAGEDGRRHIIIITHINDLHLLGRSMNKRAMTVRESWGAVETYCGKDEQDHKAYLLATYIFGEDCFEFIIMPDLMRFLEETPSIANQYVGTAELLGVEVKALKALDFLESLKLREIQQFHRSNKTWDLLDAAYLLYRKPELKCLG